MSCTVCYQYITDARDIIEPPLATERTAYCIGAVHLFVCLSVCRENAKKRDFLKKTKQFRATVSVDDL